MEWGLGCGLHAFLDEHGAHEFVPFCHGGTLLGHVVPSVIALGADILQSVVLQAISYLLGEAGLAGKRFPSPA